MSNTNTIAAADEKESLSADNLVELGEAKTGNNPNELNTKLGNIDKGLDELQQALTDTNQSMSKSLARLSDSDADLTSKVSATYKQLGNLEESYTALTDKSVSIKKEIDTVSKALVDLSDKSNSDIEKLNEGHEDLVERIHELVEKSRQTARTLNKSIKDNAKAMQELESKLGSEIESLAATTKDRSDALAGDIKNHQARLLKLQEVDKALEQRTKALEGASEDLYKKSKALSRSHNLLDKRATNLAEEVAQLQQITQDHSGMIGNLQGGVIALSDHLTDVETTGKKRFFGVTSILVILAIAIAAFFMHQQTNWTTETEKNVVVNNNIQTINNKLTSIGQSMQEMDDSLKSLDGRLSARAPLHQFGGDNTIHGPQWLAKVTDPYIIQLAIVAAEQDMYKLADFYSSYLEHKLSYMTLNDGRFIVYYGGFKNLQDAQAALSALPHYVKFERPVIAQTYDVQMQMIKASTSLSHR